MHGAFKGAAYLAALLALMFAVPPTHAQSPPTSDDDLRGRLERLETQNKELTTALQQLQAFLVKQQAPTPPPAAGSKNVWETIPNGQDALGTNAVNEILQKQMPRADGESIPAPKDLDKKQVESIVNDWWSKKEKDKKAADERKSLEEEAAGYEVGKDQNFKVKWNYGLWAESADQAFKVHIGGRAQWDYCWMNDSPNMKFPVGPLFNDKLIPFVNSTDQVPDGFNPRRARLECDGTIYEVINFIGEWDFANAYTPSGTGIPSENNTANTPVPTDVWVEITKMPIIGNFRVGNIKPPISFEHLTSSRFLNFLERSFAFDTYVGGLNNGWQPGCMMYNWSRNERMTWAIGLFKYNERIFGWNIGDGNYDVTGRLTCLPIYLHDGRCLVHLGLGASHRGMDNNLYLNGLEIARLRARTLLRNGPLPLHTGLIDGIVAAHNQTLVVPEFAMVWGPFSMQAEYFGSWHSNVVTPLPLGPLQTSVPPSNRGLFTQSAYVEALYFLTGEHRPYLLHGGPGASFTRVIPHRNFYWVPGETNNLFSSGAWQVGARYSWIDLNGIPGGGVLHDVTLGLNWFLNPNMKFQWNYSMTHRDSATLGSGDVQGLGIRLAYDW